MTNNGVKFEEQIAECNNKPNLKFEPKVHSAVKVLTSFFGKKEAFHRKSVSLKGMGLPPEIKADMWLDKVGTYGTSIKLDGAIQLSSAQGANTAKALQLCYESIKEDLVDSECEAIESLIGMIGELPTKMVSAPNLLKAFKRKAYMIQVFDEIPQFKLAVVEEMLTGRLQFAHKTIGVADYILTPNYCGYIDKKYVQKVADCVKIDVRGKSRGGITAAVVRFDAKA